MNANTNTNRRESKKAALVIGLNYEACASGMQLRGCHNDARNMKEYLVRTRGGYAEEDVELRVDLAREPASLQATSYAGIVDGIRALARASHERRLEEVFIHYSGHGTQVRDDGGYEMDGRDEALVPWDCRRSGMLRDDTLNELFCGFHADTRVVFVTDCCHSGTMCDLPFKYDVLQAEKGREVVEERLDVPRVPAARVVTLSGCRDHQVSMDAFDVCGERRFTGAMSSCLLQVLAEKPQDAGTWKPRDLLMALHHRLRHADFAQKPVLCCSVRQDGTVPLF